MTEHSQMSAAFDICIIAQAGRLSYEAVLFAASLRHSAPDFPGRLIVGEPRFGPLWPKDPSIDEDAKTALLRLNATIQKFDSQHFGSTYPIGNKVEFLAQMPQETPFVFFDTDTLITGPVDKIPFDFKRPSASMARENTWPKEPLYGPKRAAIWQAVFERSGTDITPTLDLARPESDWERFMYFNAGWFFASNAKRFGQNLCDLMVSLTNDTPKELAAQALYPWLDQIALPAIIAKHNGGRPGPELAGLDGDVSLHWRALPLIYAKAPDQTLALLKEVTAPNWIKKVLKLYEPFKRILYQDRGAKIRALFDQNHLPKREQAIRNRIKREGLWMR